MRELVIEDEDGAIVIPVHDDGQTTYCADLEKLDNDLQAISASVDVELPELDDTAYTSPLGLKIAAILEEVNATAS